MNNYVMKKKRGEPMTSIIKVVNEYKTQDENTLKEIVTEKMCKIINNILKKQVSQNSKGC